MPPSRQLYAQWVVKPWGTVPEELVRKSWKLCDYKSMEDLASVEACVSESLVVRYNTALTEAIEGVASG